MTIFVIDVGNTYYGRYTLPMIEDLCLKNNINLFVLDKDIPQNKYGLHPSWLKLFCHSLVEDDFILCWDLDLVPTRIYDLKSIIDTSRINMAYDRCHTQEGFTFNGKFRYNCGLIGIPKSYQGFIEGIYEKHASHAQYPSYEQYYVNDEIYDNNLDIALLSQNLNFMYGGGSHRDGSFEYPEDALNIHYTWKILSPQHRIELIADHYDSFKKNFNTMEIFETREELLAFLGKGKEMTIAEIGVFKGEFSKFLFGTLNPKELFLVDIFEGYMGSGDKNGENMQYTYLEYEYDNLTKYFQNENVKVLKGKSQDFLSGIEDEYLDLIYIDGDHDYSGVKLDLNLSYDKVKKGGFICGHDYVSPRFEGVVRAVNEFCQERSLKIDYLTKDGCPTYCITKK